MLGLFLRLFLVPQAPSSFSPCLDVESVITDEAQTSFVCLVTVIGSFLHIGLDAS